MKQDPHDPNLRERFQALRAADEHAAPPFEKTWNAALVQTQAPRLPLRSTQRPSHRMARFAVAATLLVTGGIALGLWQLNQPPALALSAWQSPTQVLLPTASPLPSFSLPNPQTSGISQWAAPTDALLPLE